MWKCARWLVVPVIGMVLCSCAFWGDRTQPPGPVRSDEVTDVADAEAVLRSTVDRMLSGADSGPGSARLIHAKPYYFKEYVVYPDGAGSFELEIRETSSKTKPYVAEVSHAKVRYATRLRRKREDAQGDGAFRRGTGTETVSFVLRNSRWIETGRLFVAEKVEEQVNGEWVPLREEVQSLMTVDQEDDGGFLRGIWSTISGN
jgi:hypothetical protein